MEWYRIEFEPFDNPLGKHYLGYYDGEFVLVPHGAANFFSEKALQEDTKLLDFLKDKKYLLLTPLKAYDILKYRF